MSTGLELGALEALRVAHARAAPVEEILDLADAAIEGARERADVSALREIADELTAAAAEHGPAGHGLTIAAARARAAIQETAPGAGVEPIVAVEAERETDALVRSGWWRRVGAFVLDWALLLIVGGWIATSDLPIDSGAAVFFLIPFLYFSGLHAASGRTIGKLATGIAVRRENGDALSPGVAIGRSAIQVVLAVIPFGFFVDSLWPLWDRQNQALHDKAAGTIVLRVR